MEPVVLSPATFASNIRRRELARFALRIFLATALTLTVPLGVLLTGRVAGAIARVRSDPSLVLEALALSGLPAMIAVFYVAAACNGRTVSPPAGSVEVTEGRVRLALGGLATEFRLMEVCSAVFHVDATPFEDIGAPGLADVLVLRLESGASIRIPETAQGVMTLRDLLRNRRGIPCELRGC